MFYFFPTVLQNIAAIMILSTSNYQYSNPVSKRSYILLYRSQYAAVIVCLLLRSIRSHPTAIMDEGLRCLNYDRSTLGMSLDVRWATGVQVEGRAVRGAARGARALEWSTLKES